MNLGLILGLTCLSVTPRAGGPGPVEFKKWSGSVLVRSNGPDCTFRKSIDDKGTAVPKEWQPVRAGMYVGRFLLRTGPRSWVHMNGKLACVDRCSVVLFDSGSDIWAAVLRGRLSDVDGRRGKAILRPGQSRIW